jgi:hypothetical protein
MLFRPGNPAIRLILAANPRRVFISRLGRFEVYQPIPPPSSRSPQGHASAALTAWLASFDSAAPDEADDEAALHHEG